MAFAVLALVLADTAAAQPPPPKRNPGADPVFERFLTDLRRASAADDRRAIADMIEYPLRFMAGPFNVPIRNRAEFLRYADAILTPDVREAIERGPVTLGVVIGPNVVRLRRVGGALKIVAITLPTIDGGWRAARPGTQHVQFRSGQNTARFSGALAKGERESYAIRAMRGRLLEIRINGVRGRDVVAKIFDAATHMPVDARAENGTRAWTHRAPADADYRIEVIRLTAGRDAVMTYEMQVSMR